MDQFRGTRLACSCFTKQARDQIKPSFARNFMFTFSFCKVYNIKYKRKTGANCLIGKRIVFSNL